MAVCSPPPPLAVAAAPTRGGAALAPVAPTRPFVVGDDDPFDYQDGEPGLTAAQRRAKNEDQAVLLVEFRTLEYALRAVEDGEDDTKEHAHVDYFYDDVFHLIDHIGLIADFLDGETCVLLSEPAEAVRRRQAFARGLICHGDSVRWAQESFDKTIAALVSVLDRHDGEDSCLERDCRRMLWSTRLYEGVFHCAC